MNPEYIERIQAMASDLEKMLVSIEYTATSCRRTLEELSKQMREFGFLHDSLTTMIKELEP